MTSFHDLEQYVALPRVSGLVLSPDGSRLVTSVATLDAKATKFVTALWEVDPTGEKPARRLTRSAKGEASAAFTQDGDLLFTSARPDPDGKADDDEPVPALWLMPRDGAEARVVADRAAGLGGVQVARDADVLLVGSDVLPSATDAETDERLRKARKDKKVQAILHDGYPVRFWDHDLGPESPHLFVADIGADVVAPLAGAKDPRLALTDVTPGARSALVEQASAISPDGRTVVTGWNVPLARGVAAVDGSSRSTWRRGSTGCSSTTPPRTSCRRWSPRTGSGSRTCARPCRRRTTPPASRCSWSRWPAGSRGRSSRAGTGGRSTRSGCRTARDCSSRPTTTVAARCSGSTCRRTQVTRLTSDDATFTDVSVSPDGSVAFALRTSYEAPSHPVRIDLETGATTALRSPAATPELPGTLTEVETTAADGRRVRAWLALPEGDGRRPRCCCGSTAVRWGRGTRGRGGGTRGSSSRAATRSCCPTRRCPPGTARTSCRPAGGRGARRRTRT